MMWAVVALAYFGGWTANDRKWRVAEIEANERLEMRRMEIERLKLIPQH